MEHSIHVSNVHIVWCQTTVVDVRNVTSSFTWALSLSIFLFLFLFLSSFFFSISILKRPHLYYPQHCCWNAVEMLLILSLTKAKKYIIPSDAARCLVVTHLYALNQFILMQINKNKNWWSNASLCSIKYKKYADNINFMKCFYRKTKKKTDGNQLTSVDVCFFKQFIAYSINLRKWNATK